MSRAGSCKGWAGYRGRVLTCSSYSAVAVLMLHVQLSISTATHVMQQLVMRVHASALQLVYGMFGNVPEPNLALA